MPLSSHNFNPIEIRVYLLLVLATSNAERQITSNTTQDVSESTPRAKPNPFRSFAPSRKNLPVTAHTRFTLADHRRHPILLSNKESTTLLEQAPPPHKRKEMSNEKNLRTLNNEWFDRVWNKHERSAIFELVKDDCQIGGLPPSDQTPKEAFALSRHHPRRVRQVDNHTRGLGRGRTDHRWRRKNQRDPSRDEPRC
jgi:hypothetical protein